MVRIIILIISLSVLGVLISPFTEYLLEMRGTFAHAIAGTGLVTPLGVTAIFSSITATFLLSIYRFFH